MKVRPVLHRFELHAACWRTFVAATVCTLFSYIGRITAILILPARTYSAQSVEPVHRRVTLPVTLPAHAFDPPQVGALSSGPLAVLGRSVAQGAWRTHTHTHTPWANLTCIVAPHSSQGTPNPLGTARKALAKAFCFSHPGGDTSHSRNTRIFRFKGCTLQQQQRLEKACSNEGPFM